MERVIGARFDHALLGHTFERAVAKVEEEVPARSRTRPENAPIIWCVKHGRITRHEIELAPRGSQLAESAFASIPTLVIGGAEAVALGIYEAQDASFVRSEMLELKRVYEESEEYVAALYDHVRARSIWLGIPALIELNECRAHRPNLRTQSSNRRYMVSSCLGIELVIVGLTPYRALALSVCRVGCAHHLPSGLSLGHWWAQPTLRNFIPKASSVVRSIH